MYLKVYNASVSTDYRFVYLMTYDDGWGQPEFHGCNIVLKCNFTHILCRGKIWKPSHEAKWLYT